MRVIVLLCLVLGLVPVCGERVEAQAPGGGPWILARVTWNAYSGLAWGDFSGGYNATSVSPGALVYMSPGNTLPFGAGGGSVQVFLADQGSGVFRGDFTLYQYRANASSPFFSLTGGKLVVTVELDIDANGGKSLFVGGVPIYGSRGEDSNEVNFWLWEPINPSTVGDFPDITNSIGYDPPQTFAHDAPWSPLLCHVMKPHGLVPVGGGNVSCTVTGLIGGANSGYPTGTSSGSTTVTTRPSVAPSCMADLESYMADKLGLGSLFTKSTGDISLPMEPVETTLFGHTVRFDPNPTSSGFSGNPYMASVNAGAVYVKGVATFFVIVSFLWLLYKTLKAW